MQHLQVLRRGRRLAGKRIFNGAQNESERSAQLVTHVAEERGLGAIQLGEFFSAFSFLLIGVGVVNAGGDLAGDEIEKSLVKAVELPVGVERGNEDADRLFLPLPGDGNQARAGGRPVPASRRKIGKKLEEIVDGKCRGWCSESGGWAMRQEIRPGR